MHKIKLEGDIMYEKLAWDNFLKTGNIESFLEYRKIAALNNNLNNIQENNNKINCSHTFCLLK